MKYTIIIQAIIAFGIGITSLLIVYKMLNSYLRNRLQIDEKNTAYGIFQAGIILSTAMVLSSVIDPGINAIRFLNQDNIQISGIMLSIGYVLLFMLIGIAFTFLIIAGGVITLFQMTHTNEWEELKNNNIAIAIISAAVILGLAFIVDDYVGHLCEIIVPYPDVLQIR
jgi:uncharacterized membrane protein YjfL (UPF0719 family)